MPAFFSLPFHEGPFDFLFSLAHGMTSWSCSSALLHSEGHYQSPVIKSQCTLFCDFWELLGIRPSFLPLQWIFYTKNKGTWIKIRLMQIKVLVPFCEKEVGRHFAEYFFWWCCILVHHSFFLLCAPKLHHLFGFLIYKGYVFRPNKWLLCCPWRDNL